MYDALFRHALRRIPSETAHRLGAGLIRGLGSAPLAGPRLGAALGPSDPVLRVRALGLEFAGPLGLAAGFDKNARHMTAAGRIGFGAVEIGTVTGRAQPGNPRPRLFRLPDDRALVNRMGFNNAGAPAVAARLEHWRAGRPAGYPVLGVNIGRSKVVPPDEAIDDYRTSARLLGPHADYMVVNVSSPNTPGLRDLQQVDALEPLLSAVREELDALPLTRPVPLLVKITVDLADDDVDAVADLAVRVGLDGIVATNTTVSREGLTSDPATIADAGAGGLSGRPLSDRSLAVLMRLRRRLGAGPILISAGGIEDAHEAYRRIRAGASLVQAYTAFVYGGLLWPSRLHRDLAALLRADGHRSVNDAVGSGI